MLVYLFCHCNSGAEESCPMLKIITPAMDVHRAHCPAFSRMLFETPPFSCRKKAIKSKLTSLGPGTPLPASLSTQRGTCPWRHQRQGPDGSCSAGLGSAGPEQFTLSCPELREQKPSGRYSHCRFWLPEQQWPSTLLFLQYTHLATIKHRAQTRGAPGVGGIFYTGCPSSPF